MLEKGRGLGWLLAREEALFWEALWNYDTSMSS